MLSEIFKSLTNPVNLLIILLGIIVWVMLGGISKKLSELEDRAKNAYRQTKSQTAINLSNKSVETAITNNLDITVMDDIVEDFNATGAKYQSWVQIISILPLLGLFGTVLGLIPGLMAVAQENLDVLYNSLSTALFSTFWGILFAMILKFYVAFGPAKHVSSIENKLAENDRKFSQMAAFNKLTDLQ